MIDGKPSPAWSPVDFPPPGQAPSDPPEATVRYSISPRPTPGFETSVRNQLAVYISQGFPGQQAMPSFIDPDSGTVQYPCVTLLMRDGRRVVDICFATRLQAASFGQIDCFTVEMGGGKMSHTLRRWKSGVCHSRGLITMKVTPEVDRGDNPHRVERKAYKDAVSALLKAFPVLSFVGAWRQAVEWTNGTVQYQPVMLLVVRRPVGFLLHMLPGFVNTSGVPVRGCDEAPADAIWFHLQFGGRQSFCRYCKTAIHGPEECPNILCNTCHERGHIAAACPRGGRKTGRRGRNNGRGGRA